MLTSNHTLSPDVDVGMGYSGSINSIFRANLDAAKYAGQLAHQAEHKADDTDPGNDTGALAKAELKLGSETRRRLAGSLLPAESRPLFTGLLVRTALCATD